MPGHKVNPFRGSIIIPWRFFFSISTAGRSSSSVWANSKKTATVSCCHSLKYMCIWFKARHKKLDYAIFWILWSECVQNPHMQWLQRQGRNDEKQLPNYKPILPRIPTLTPGAVPITRIRSDDLGMVNEIRTSLGSLSPLQCFCLTKATCNKHVGMSQNSEVLTCPQTQSFYYLTHYPIITLTKNQCLDVQFSVEDVMPPLPRLLFLLSSVEAFWQRDALLPSPPPPDSPESSEALLGGLPSLPSHGFHPLGSRPSARIIQLDWCVKSQK